MSQQVDTPSKWLSPAIRKRSKRWRFPELGEANQFTLSLKPESSGPEATPVAQGPPILAPKAQKELGKALEALRASKFAEARAHLDVVYRLAPTHPDVNYLFGVYSSLVHDYQQAKTYWEKATAVYPQHQLAQISLSNELLRENKPEDAIPHLKKALEIEPNSWRAHALLADADLRLGSSEEAVREAERAIELGHERAAEARPILARALVAQGKTDRAIQILESYLQEHSADTAAQTQLASLRTPPAVPTNASSAPAAPVVSVAPALASLSTVATLPLPSSWLPPMWTRKCRLSSPESLPAGRGASERRKTRARIHPQCGYISRRRNLSSTNR